MFYSRPTLSVPQCGQVATIATVQVDECKFRTKSHAISYKNSSAIYWQKFAGESKKKNLHRKQYARDNFFQMLNSGREQTADFRRREEKSNAVDSRGMSTRSEKREEGSCATDDK